MRVLGLDPGIRNTGWAVLEVLRPRGQVRLLRSGVITTPPRTPHARGQLLLHGGLRHVGLADIDEAVVENQTRWAGLAIAWATCMTWVRDAGWEPMTVRASMVRKLLGAPSGAAGKKAVHRALTSLLGGPMLYQHEADAAAVALLGIHLLGWLDPQALAGGPK